jgi:hypothetical protein
LAEHGLAVHERDNWSESQREYLSGYFSREIDPLLTPMAIEELSPQPLLPGLQLNVVLADAVETDEGRQKRVAIVPVPGNCPRFIQLPSDEGVHLARLEDVIADNAEKLFPGCEATAKTVIRITRDADVSIEDDDASDLLNVVEETVIARGRRRVVRLAVSAGVDRELLKWLKDWLGLQADEVYEIDGMLDAKALWQLVGLPEFESLTDADWPPSASRGSDRLREYLADRARTRRDAVPSLRIVRSGRPARGRGGRRSQRAGDQTDSLPDERQLADRQGPLASVRQRQGSHRTRRVEGPLRRGRQRRLGSPTGRRRLPRDLRYRRFEDPRQGPADRAARIGAHSTLRSPGDR